MDREGRADGDRQREADSGHEGDVGHAAQAVSEPLRVGLRRPRDQRERRRGQQPRDAVREFDDPERDAEVAGYPVTGHERGQDHRELKVENAESRGRCVHSGLPQQRNLVGAVQDQHDCGGDRGYREERQQRGAQDDEHDHPDGGGELAHELERRHPPQAQASREVDPERVRERHQQQPAAQEQRAEHHRVRVADHDREARREHGGNRNEHDAQAQQVPDEPAARLQVARGVLA